MSAVVDEVKSAIRLKNDIAEGSDCSAVNDSAKFLAQSTSINGENLGDFGRRKASSGRRRQKRNGTWTSVFFSTCSTIRERGKSSINSIISSFSSMNLHRTPSSSRQSNRRRSCSLQAINDEDGGDTDPNQFELLLSEAQKILDDYIKSTDLTISNSKTDRYIDELDGLVKLARKNRNSLLAAAAGQSSSGRLEKEMYEKRLKRMIETNPGRRASSTKQLYSQVISPAEKSEIGKSSVTLIKGVSYDVSEGASAPPCDHHHSTSQQLSLIPPLVLTNPTSWAAANNNIQPPIYCDRIYSQPPNELGDWSQFMAGGGGDLGTALRSFISPTAVVCLDRFTTSCYVVPNNADQKFYVVFGGSMNQISTIKVYDIDGNDLGELSPPLNFKWELNNAYRVHTVGQNISIHCNDDDDSNCLIEERCMIVNEIKGYHLTDGYYALKQRLLFFDLKTGSLRANTKRLTEVVNPLESVHLDSDDNGQLYVFDTITLMSVNKWAKKMDRVRSVSVGKSFIACIFDRQVIICGKDGHQKFSWLVQRLGSNFGQTRGGRRPSSMSVCPICLKIYEDYVYVLAWLTDNYPSNNILIKFDKEGNPLREFYLPNRIYLNNHNEYEFDCGMAAQVAGVLAQPIINQATTWPVQQQQFQMTSSNQTAMNQTLWNCWAHPLAGSMTNDLTAPTAHFAPQFSHGPFMNQESGGMNSILHNGADSSSFHATWFTITEQRNAIVTNIAPENPVAPSKKVIVVPIP